MAVTVGSIEISRRPGDVFAYVSDPLYIPEWDDTAESAQREDLSPLTVGTRTTVRHRMGPFKLPTIEEVVELDPPRRYTSRGSSGPLTGVARCAIEPLDGGRRSRLRIALDIEARGLGKLILPLARRRSRKVIPKHLRKMKEILDGDVVIAGGRYQPSARA